MSYVTSILITVNHPIYAQNVTLVNEWLRSEDGYGYGDESPQLKNLNLDGAGGTKYMEIDVWAAGLNAVNHEFPAFLDSLEWGEQCFCIVVGENGGRTWGEPWGDWTPGFHG